MTDERSTLAEELTVSVDDFNRFAKAKGIDRECDECGDNAWALPLRDGYQDGDLTAPIQLAALPGLGNGRSIPVHTMLCKSCGFIKLVNAATVRVWVNENG